MRLDRSWLSRAGVPAVLAGLVLGLIAFAAPGSGAPAGSVAEAWPDVARSGPNTARLAGPDRYGTAAAVSLAAFPSGVPVVYVATGTTFPDALAAGPAAAVEGGPIVLTATGVLPAPTRTELARLAPERVVVLGGPGAVTDDVATALEAVTGRVPERLAGPDRYATAAAVSTRRHPAGATRVYVATGENFPDALAGGPLAAQTDSPLLLVRADRIPPATAQELARLAPDEIVILGGEGAVSAEVEAALASFAAVNRIAGADRFATAVEISRAGFAAAPVVYLATGLDFPDALAGGPAAFGAGGPILLTRTGCVPQVVLGEIGRLDPDRVVVLGGTGAVSEAAAALTGCGGSAGATFYVRPDGGSPDQCTGGVDAPYPGSGSLRDCAWDHPFRALPPQAAPRIDGGDTLVIGAGAYMMGFGAPGAEACDTDDRWGCAPAPLPSGPDAAHPTRILGSGWDTGCTDPPQLWGTEAVSRVLDLTGAAHVRVACLDITDHSGCVEYHTGGLACPRDEAPFGPWAGVGIYAEDARDVSLADLDVHGLADAGIRAGRLTDWTVERVRVAANGWVGWDGDIEGDDSNAGEMVFRRLVVEWNGCGETYPGAEPTGCWAQSAGGYGDGLGTGLTGGAWLFEDSVFRANTSDGLDLFYLRAGETALTVRRTHAEGNAGDQVKTAGPAHLENLLAVSNCGFHQGQPFTFDVDACRAGGSAAALNLGPGDDVVIVNSTLTGEGDCLVIAECFEGESCGGGESVVVRNALFLGNPEYGEADTTCLDWHSFAADPFTFDHVILDGVKTDRSCPATGVCDPGVAIVLGRGIDAFDGRPVPAGPAVDAGTPAGAPPDDVTGASRDAIPDVGAYEAG